MKDISSENACCVCRFAGEFRMDDEVGNLGETAVRLVVAETGELNEASSTV